jgi:hypothetical protein
MNNQHKPVDYKMVQNHVEISLNRKVALATIKRYGRIECGITSRTTHEITTGDSKYTGFYTGHIIVLSHRLRIHLIILLYL